MTSSLVRQTLPKTCFPSRWRAQKFVHMPIALVFAMVSYCISAQAQMETMNPIEDDVKQDAASEAETSSSIASLLSQSFTDTSKALDSLVQNPQYSLEGTSTMEHNAAWGCWLGSFCGGPCVGSVSTLLAGLYGASQTPDEHSWALILLGATPGIVIGGMSILYAAAGSSLLGFLNLTYGSTPGFAEPLYGLTFALSVVSLLFYVAGPATLYGMIFAENWRLSNQETLASRHEPTKRNTRVTLYQPAKRTRATQPMSF